MCIRLAAKTVDVEDSLKKWLKYTAYKAQLQQLLKAELKILLAVDYCTDPRDRQDDVYSMIKVSLLAL